MGLQCGLDNGAVCDRESCTVQRRMGDEGAALVGMFGVGGDSPPELNTLMSLTRGPSHALAHTWPTNQYTYVGQWSSLNRNLTAGPTCQ